MGRKRKHVAVVERPIFCFYCDRTFADETTLIVHQKGKHFKCTECSKRLNSVGGCAIHLLQVHRIEIKAVPNAKEDRGGLEWEIFGMAGVPDGMMPGGPVPEDDTASKAQQIADEQGGPGQAGTQAAPGQYYPPVSGGHAGSMPYPMMPPPHGFPPMPPGSFGMHPPGMPPPFMYRPPPPLYPSDRHPPPSLQPPHPATSNPASSMPPGSMPPGSMGLGGMPAGSSGVPGLQPHTSGPLFPLDLPKADAAAATEPPGTTAPGEAAVVEPTLIWKDDRFCMEERRAQMIQSRTPPPPLRPTSFAAAPSLRQATQPQPPYQLPYEQPRQPTYQMPQQPQQQQQQQPQQQRQQLQRDEMFVPQQPTRY